MKNHFEPGTEPSARRLLSLLAELVQIRREKKEWNVRLSYGKTPRNQASMTLDLRILMDYGRPCGDVIRWTTSTAQAKMSETDITFARLLSTLMPCFLGGTAAMVFN